MPIYEFQCENCGRTHEKICVLSEAQSGSTCKCGGRMNRIISAAIFITDETRARRILSKGRPAKGTRGKGKTWEEKNLI